MSAGPASPERAYARVVTRIAVRFHRASENEVVACEETVVARETGADELPAALVSHLRNIEHKLQLVLSLLDRRYAPPLDPVHDQRNVILSAGGLLIEAPHGDLAVGDQVALELLLPGESPRSVHAIAVVTRLVAESDPSDGLRGVATEYVLIDESDRDAIVRLVNRLQLAAAGRLPKARP